MRASLSLTYDDALAVHRCDVAPDLARRGIRATFYIPAAADDVHEQLDGWRRVAEAGHELGNHSCWHPCRGRPAWLPPCYHLETYDRRRMRDELVLANRLLHLIDGRRQRTYAATCNDTECGEGSETSQFIDDMQDLFPAVRVGSTTEPLCGQAPFLVPKISGDRMSADQLIAICRRLRDGEGRWLVVLFHGVGAGSHQSFIESQEHVRFVQWVADQSSWLDAIPMVDAVLRRKP